MPTDIVKRLQEQRLKVWEQAKELAERAAEENRAFEAAEQDQWDTMNAEIDALDRRMKSIAEAEQRAKETEEKFAEIEGRETTAGKKPDSVNTELRSFLRGEGGRTYEVKPPEGTQFRDLTVGTATAGGNTVPEGFYGRLVQHMIEVSGVLQTNPTVLNTASGETIPIPKTTAHSSAEQEHAEGTPIPESDPAFGQEDLGAFKYPTLLQVSRELIDDTGVDLEGYLSMQAGRALGNAIGERFVTGSGSGQPAGVVTQSSLGVTGPTGVGGGFGSQSTADQGYDTIIDMYYSVIAPYRASASCAWLMNDQTAAQVRKIKSSEGVYVFQPSRVVGSPDTIEGKPVRYDPFVPDVAVSATSVLFGDFSQFFVRFAGGVRFERSDDFAFDSDLVTYRAVLRGDSVLVDQTGAIKHFAGAAT